VQPDEGEVTTAITFGTYDVFHVGHLRLLQRARSLADRLVVGVSTDELNTLKKGTRAVFPQDQRREIVDSLRCVDETFFEESLERKREYVTEASASLLVMGDDWEGRFDDLRDVCQVIYLPRTPSVSTTHTIETIRLSSGDPV
jgi:glycerol-3-phosphate cytidylyltransferase